MRELFEKAQAKFSISSCQLRFISTVHSVCAQFEECSFIANNRLTVWLSTLFAQICQAYFPSSLYICSLFASVSAGQWPLNVSSLPFSLQLMKPQLNRRIWYPLFVFITAVAADHGAAATREQAGRTEQGVPGLCGSRPREHAQLTPATPCPTPATPRRQLPLAAARLGRPRRHRLLENPTTLTGGRSTANQNRNRPRGEPQFPPRRTCAPRGPTGGCLRTLDRSSAELGTSTDTAPMWSTVAPTGRFLVRALRRPGRRAQGDRRPEIPHPGDQQPGQQPGETRGPPAGRRAGTENGRPGDQQPGLTSAGMQRERGQRARRGCLLGGRHSKWQPGLRMLGWNTRVGEGAQRIAKWRAKTFTKKENRYLANRTCTHGRSAEMWVTSTVRCTPALPSTCMLW